MTTKASDSLLMRIVIGTLATILFVIIADHAHGPKMPWVFLAILALIGGMALWEYYEMTVGMGFRPMIRTGIWSSALFFLAVLLQIGHPSLYFLPAAVLLLLLITAFVLQLTRDVKDPVSNLAVTIFGFAYIILPLSCILCITYQFSFGNLWLIYLVFVTKITDVGAFIVGKTMGKHLLAPTVSPKKTIEGAIGGFVFAIGLSLAILFYYDHATSVGPFNTPLLVEALILGIIISALAQLGDLSESLLKRNAGIKDSSRLPGLGGVLDIMDSLIFTAPALYVYLLIVADK
ncbi:MAG: phosphatidate cytidylyltransferase [Chlamydiales bacterium]|nr:phosphatidate cytidylyltransferase [Chlamydiales bacterium]